MKKIFKFFWWLINEVWDYLRSRVVFIDEKGNQTRDKSKEGYSWQK